MFPFLICLEFVWINSSPTVAGLIAPCASALPWACPWILCWPVSPCAGGVCVSVGGRRRQRWGQLLGASRMSCPFCPLLFCPASVPISSLLQAALDSPGLCPDLEGTHPAASVLCRPLRRVVFLSGLLTTYCQCELELFFFLSQPVR